jgi:signal transduction histidine kinase
MEYKFVRKLGMYSLKKRFVAIAIFNGILIIFSLLLMFLSIQKQTDDAAYVNLAGRQRMLTQRVTKSALLLYQNQYTVKDEYYYKILEESIRLYDETLKVFINGGKIYLSGEDICIKKITGRDLELNELLNEWNTFKDVTQNYLNEYNVSDYNFIISNNEKLLMLSDELVYKLQNDANNHIRNVKVLSFIIVIFELIILIIVLRFVTYGLIKPFRRLFGVLDDIGKGNEIQYYNEKFDEWIQTTDHIKESHNSLKNARNELERLNKELEKKVQLRTMELEKTYKSLLEIEKQASLVNLVAGISHEANTPLGVCVTGISKLKDENKDIFNIINNGELTKDKLIDYLKMSLEIQEILDFNITRASETIKSFKRILVDQTNENLESFNIKDYFDKIVSSLNHEIKKVNCVINYQIEDMKVISYPGIFAQIFTNLIMNSLVHGKGNKNELKITVLSSYKDGYLYFIFKDDGIGIIKDSINNIFDPFYTTKRDKGNSGLGLNVVHQLVTKRLDGTIECKSEEGKYTEFLIKMKILLEVNNEQ